MYDPLIQYHNMLRSAAPAGYPNTPMMSPHPYEMQQFSMGMRPKQPPFRYHNGRFQRLPIQSRPMNRMTLGGMRRRKQAGQQYGPANALPPRFISR